MNLDGEKLGLWKGLFISLHGETRYGESANSLTGSMMPPNLMLALPGSNGTVHALSGVKFTQFLSETMLVYGGKINTFDGFVQPLTGATGLSGFQNAAMMFNPVYARTVPYSTFGAGFAFLHEMEPVISAAVFDTNNTPTVSGFDTFFDNGATIFAQLNVPTPGSKLRRERLARILAPAQTEPVRVRLWNGPLGQSDVLVHSLEF